MQLRIKTFWLTELVNTILPLYLQIIKYALKLGAKDKK